MNLDVYRKHACLIISNYGQSAAAQVQARVSKSVQKKRLSDAQEWSKVLEHIQRIEESYSEVKEFKQTGQVVSGRATLILAEHGLRSGYTAYQSFVNVSCHIDEETADFLESIIYYIGIHSERYPALARLGFYPRTF